MERYIYTIDENNTPIGVGLTKSILMRIKKIQEDFKKLEKSIHDEEVQCIKRIKDFLNLTDAKIWLKITENTVLLESSFEYNGQITTNFKNILTLPKIYFAKEFIVSLREEKSNLELIKEVLLKMPPKHAKMIKVSLQYE
jgi:hypothetical protein